MKEFNEWFNDGNAIQIGVDQYMNKQRNILKYLV
jgi:hypothetical protein